MKYTLNLATRAYVNRRTLYMSYALIGSLLIIVFIFNMSRMFSLNGDINRYMANIEAIETKILARTGVEVADYSEENYRKMLENIQYANDILLRDSFRWSSFLDQMENIVPGQVRVLRINPSYKERSVNLVGQAKNLNSLKNFIDNIIQSENYSHVFLERQASEPQSMTISFSIRLEGAF